jgi:cell division protein FtsA
VAVLDVGTSKVSALIALLSSDGSARIIGSGQKPCAGLKRGTVTDFDKTEMAIRGAMDQAERAAGLQMDSVIASFAAGNLASSMAGAEIDIAGANITPTDMVTLRQAGRAAIDPRGRSVIHALPALYTLDGLPGIESPLGLHADRLGVDIHVVTADTPAILNFTRAVGQAHLGLAGLVSSPIAASLAVLDDEERDIGVALIEIGAGLTSIAVHKFGIVVGVATVPMGSADITDDIAAAFDLHGGGQCRTGLEDNIRWDETRLAKSNAELVKRVADLCTEYDRHPASAAEARGILGLAPA